MQNRRGFLKTLALTSLTLGASSHLLAAENRAYKGADNASHKTKETHKHKGDKMNESQVWYITGASGGLGLAFGKVSFAKK